MFGTTGLACLKDIGRGGFSLSTILDDHSRHVIGWKLRGTMRAEDVTDTLAIALAASGCDSAKVLRKPPHLAELPMAAPLTEWMAPTADTAMCHIGCRHTEP